jgi:hypothetical protein
MLIELCPCLQQLWWVVGHFPFSVTEFVQSRISVTWWQAHAFTLLHTRLSSHTIAVWLQASPENSIMLEHCSATEGAATNFTERLCPNCLHEFEVTIVCVPLALCNGLSSLSLSLQAILSPRLNNLTLIRKNRPVIQICQGWDARNESLPAKSYQFALKCCL